VLYYLVNNRVYQRFRAEPIMAFEKSRMHLLAPEQQVELYRRIVDRMNALCQSRGVPFAVVFGYLRSELNRQIPAFLDAPSRLSADRIMTIDLHDSLRAAEGAGPTLYYRNDIHWNASGHARVAQLLAPIVGQMLHQRVVATTPTVR
jgi:hypothetical protein